MYLQTKKDALESQYIYTAKNGNCMDTYYQGYVGTTGYANVQPYSVPQLKAAINLGPVSVTVEADKSAW